MKQILILLLLVCSSLSWGLAPRQPPKPVRRPTRDQTGPYNLMAELIGDNNIMLMWENPAFNNLPMGFRVYCNTCLACYIPGANVTDCYLDNVCEGCHQFYVTAWFDTECESAPSNIAELMVTALAVTNAAGQFPAITAYPSPARSGMSISLSGTGKRDPARIGIFNVKGQLVRQFSLRPGQTGYWDICDFGGNRVPGGIYYLKAETAGGIITRKVTVLN